MKKLLLVFECIVFILVLCTCSNSIKDDNLSPNIPITPGNSQNGGYVLKNQNYYLYANPDDFNSLYKKYIDSSEIQKISGNHHFYEMNLYNGYILFVGISRRNLENIFRW